jgi:oligopeptide/dipeptide ABC transporter ATP-binding protein
MLQSPRHPYTKLLIESLPKITERGKLVGIPGLPPALLNLPKGCAFNPRCPYAFDRCREEIPAVHDVGVMRKAACHFYPELTVLPPLPSSVILDPDAPMEETQAQMEGRYEPGRADSDAELAIEMAAEEGPMAPTPSSALGISGLAQSDIDELHHGRGGS